MAVWALIGFMGCGKSSIGRLVASLSDIQFIDLDDVIASRTGRSIPDIFRTSGEAGFRDIERHTLSNVLAEVGVPPEGRATRGTEAGGPSALADGGVSEANSRRGYPSLQQIWCVEMAVLRTTPLKIGTSCVKRRFLRTESVEVIEK